MGKPKCESELVRFLWRRNVKYDIMLLEEVQTKNPFAFKNQKPVWIDIAQVLQEGPLKMKVSDRSCRERVMELLKIHRKEEVESDRASGVYEDEMTELKTLLTNVSKLEETKPDPQLKELYSKKDKADAEVVRANAKIDISDSDSDNDDVDNKPPEPKKLKLDSKLNPLDFPRGRSMSTDSDESTSKAGPSKSGPSKSGLSKSGRPQTIDDRRTNPKKDLVNYLEKKSKGEIEMRREEMLALEKRSKDEIALRREELRVREMEAQNKAAELNILRLKAEAEMEDRKKLNDLVLKMATRE